MARYKTEEERQAARRATYQRYNRSPKGSKRYKAYEAAHPERSTRWSPVMAIRAAHRGQPEELAS